LAEFFPESFFPFQVGENVFAEVDAECSTFSAGVVGEIEDETEVFEVHRFDTVLEDNLFASFIDSVTKKQCASVERENMYRNDSLAPGKVSSESVAVSAGDKHSTRWSDISYPIGFKFGEKTRVYE
jgi:hypothetical protein